MKCTKDSGSNPSVVSRDVVEDTAVGVSELATKKRSVGLNRSIKRAIHHKTRCKETFREWTNSADKGPGHSQPKGKGNHNQNQTGSPDEETEQRTLSDFGVKRQRVQVVGDVQGHDDGFEAPREDQAKCVFCVHSCENAMSEFLDVPSSSGISGVRVIEEPAGTQELKPHRTTGEMLLAIKVAASLPQSLGDLSFTQPRNRFFAKAGHMRCCTAPRIEQELLGGG